MKINVVTVKTGPNFNAGQKAPSDIVKIINNYFESYASFISNFNSEEFLNKHNIIYRILCRSEFFKIFNHSRRKKDVLLIQYPMEERTNFLNKLFLFNMNFLNKDKSIILIHDLDGIRYQNKEFHDQDIARLNKVKYVIVHNDIMKDKLIKDGVKSKIYVLKLFDYLCNYDNNIKEIKFDKNKPIIVYAGNLSSKKSPFIHELVNKDINFTLNLYGVGIDKNLSKNIIYKDKYPAEILPNKLEGNLGLIWDGKSDSSDNNIGMKNYTRYNNPHKLSCYIAAGLPVIVWKESAISKFVRENDIGYTISKIEDINKLDFSDYMKKKENVRKIQVKVRNGEYTKNVIEEILKDMGEI